MAMVTELVRVMTYCEELPPIHSLDPSSGKLNTLYFHLQKTHEHHNRQGVVLLSEVPTLKTAWSFDRVISVGNVII